MKKMTLLFPGQGSQSPGMGKFLFNEFKIAQQTFEEASDSLGLDLKKLCFDSSESELALTENTQPALLCVSTATARVLTEKIGVTVHASAGHSIGEYASFVAGGVLSFSDAMRAVRLRGQSMQAASPQGSGGMLAVLGLEDEQVQWLCQNTETKSGYNPLSPANFNSPGQIVISGNLKAIEWLKNNFKPEEIPGQPKRAKLIPLNVSAPFHCALMRPAQEKMAHFFNTVHFKDSKFPIIQNVHAKAETNAGILKDNLVRQISLPVLWTQSMQELVRAQLTNCIEAGHGSIVKGLCKKIDSERLIVMSAQNLEDIKAIENYLAE